MTPNITIDLTSACIAQPPQVIVRVRAQIILLNPINTMLAIRVIVAVALAVSTLACAEPPKRVNPVGLSFAAYEDAARRSWTGPQSRPLATAVWYPAVPGSRESEWRVGVFNAGWNAQQAPLSAATTKRPLIVLSHGTGGGAAGMAWLAETLRTAMKHADNPLSSSGGTRHADTKWPL